MDIYKLVIRPLLFSGLKADPEWLHAQSIALIERLNQHYHAPLLHWGRQQLEQRLSVNHPALQQTIFGLTFTNPLGLAAGFDKDGVGVGLWPSLGFGFTELGTVTRYAQPGNPKPRLFRLLADQGALNRMGFNNQGAAAMANRLTQYASLGLTEAADETRLGPHPTHPAQFKTPIGINLGKSKVTPLEEAAADYQASFALLKSLGDYFVVNVSSPNTPGLRSLQEADQLQRIFAALQEENDQGKPLLVKIAPDLEWQAIAAILALAQRYHLAGIVATNTTISRANLQTRLTPGTGTPITEEAGGISGLPLRQRATEVIRFIYRETGGTLPIIGVGGIFTAADAWEKILAGASLLQVYTGWIYEGPWMPRRVLNGLLQRLQRQNMTHLSEAIGQEAAVQPTIDAKGESDFATTNTNSI